MTTPALDTKRNATWAVTDPFARAGDDVLDELQTSNDGLTSADAQRRLEVAGPNALPERGRRNPVLRFLSHFHNVLIYVLIAAAVVTATLQHWVDTIVILAVVLLNAIVGFLQEGKAEQALIGLRKMLSSRADVRRDGQWQRIEAAELVPGDVIQLSAGNRVPADIRLLETIDLRIEEAALTGESVATEKSIDPVPRDSGVGDRSSMAFSSTMVTSGRGMGVVTGTGSDTEIGKISTMLAGVEQIQTPLTRQMNRFGQILSLVIVALAVVMMAVGYFVHDDSVGDLAMAAIGFAVAAIPEGLPALLSIILARGVQIMARRRAIARRLDAVETLGSVTVICSDKTGTLTKNEMTVRHVVTLGGDYRVGGTGYAPHGDITIDGEQVARTDRPDLDAVVYVAAHANDATVTEQDGTWRLVGEPTDGALRTLGIKADARPSGERIDEVPFSSEHKYMGVLEVHTDGRRRVLLKGAPDRLLNRCTTQRATDRSEEPLDRDFWEQQIERLSAEGLRVLAAAVRDGTEVDDDLTPQIIDEGGFTFLGLYGIIDPPRPEAVEAIESARSAGIRVVMITGDHAGTAVAIADEMGIGDGQTVMTGTQLEDASDDELREIARRCDVFARTSPEHKLRLVTALQATGQVVSMTGDGINDAPALKRADVGVAMGIKGTEATKESADVVLADDNFSSIARAVAQGRTIYDNLRKAIVFTLPTNGGESLVILAAVLTGQVLPLTPLQVLWINTVSAVTLGLSLAFEPAERGVMKRPPRDPKRPIIDRTLLWRIIYVSILTAAATIWVFAHLHNGGVDIDQARTSALMTLIFAQTFYLFSCRLMHTWALRPALFRTNGPSWFFIALLMVLQAVLIYVPAMNTAFDTTPLTPAELLLPLAVGAAVFLAIEAEKWATRTWAARRR